MTAQTYPDFAATTHDDSSVAATDPLVSARAVVADLTHYPDETVIAAARVVLARSDSVTERGDAEDLIELLTRPDALTRHMFGDV